VQGGLVIIINASKYSVDALIFGATGPIEQVPLPDVDMETLAEFSKNVKCHQPENVPEHQRQRYTNRFLRPTLQKVWKYIIIPIFNHIHIHWKKLPYCLNITSSGIQLEISHLFQSMLQDL